MAEMSIKKKRPKNLDLTTIKLPWSGKVSILHRISGAGLFLMLPLIIWLFCASFTAPETFAAVSGNILVKVIIAGLIWAFTHHFCAGIRFLLIDRHVCVEKEAAQQSALVVLAVSIPLTLVLWGILL